MRLQRAAPYLWPPKVRLSFYGRKRKFLYASTERDFDLSDRLMMYYPHESRIVRLGITTDSPTWKVWDDEALDRIESLIRYDLSHDGYRVRITREGVPGSKCAAEFTWKLHIRSA